MSSLIHPTAVIDPRAELAAGVEVGPYAVIGPDVRIGPDCRIGAHVVIDGRVRMGRGNRIFPGACIGLEPQDLKYTGDPTGVEIGDDNTLRECVTVNRATHGEETTRLGNGNLLMAYSHLGHNCELGDHIVVVNNVAIAGHVLIGDKAVIGGVLGIHQFVHVGTLAMVGGMSKIARDVPPYTLVDGHPARVRGLNKVGLQRCGFLEQEEGRAYDQLSRAWKHLYRSGLPLAQAMAELRQSGPLSPAVDVLVEFLECSVGPGRRGPIPRGR
jgi:UDP-N-acetylglucosamine acyltransferase